MTRTEHFDNVCNDLKETLTREEDLQKILDKNILQINEMEKRYLFFFIF